MEVLIYLRVLVMVAFAVEAAGTVRIIVADQLVKEKTLKNNVQASVA